MMLYVKDDNLYECDIKLLLIYKDIIFVWVNMFYDMMCCINEIRSCIRML